jgi:hypothetical protein
MFDARMLCKQWYWSMYALSQTLKTCIEYMSTLQDQSPAFIESLIGNPITPFYPDYDGYHEPVFVLTHPYAYDTFISQRALVCHGLMLLLLNIEDAKFCYAWEDGWYEEGANIEVSFIEFVKKLNKSYMANVHMHQPVENSLDHFVICLRECMQEGDGFFQELVNEICEFYENRECMNHRIQCLRETMNKVEATRSALGAQDTLYTLNEIETEIRNFESVDASMLRLCTGISLAFESVADLTSDFVLRK